MQYFSSALTTAVCKSQISYLLLLIYIHISMPKDCINPFKAKALPLDITSSATVLESNNSEEDRVIMGHTLGSLGL